MSSNTGRVWPSIPQKLMCKPRWSQATPIKAINNARRGAFMTDQDTPPSEEVPMSNCHRCSLVNVYTTFRPDEGRANQT